MKYSEDWFRDQSFFCRYFLKSDLFESFAITDAAFSCCITIPEIHLQ
jgi:hypothetical protein